jgi:PAS domain S-box-containing protein
MPQIMGFRIIFLIAFFFNTLLSLGQNDSERNSFLGSLNEVEKEQLLNQWLIEADNYKVWSHEARISYATAVYENAASNQPVKMKAIKSLAGLHFEAGELDKAYAYSDTLYGYAMKHKDHNSIITSSLYKGTIHRFKGDYYRALNHTYDAYRLAVDKNVSNLLSATLNSLGLIYFNLANNQKAIPLFEEALEIALEQRDTNQLILTYMYLGDLKLSQKNFDQATALFKKGLELAVENNEIVHIAAFHNKMGNVLRNSTSLDEAIEWYSKALKQLDGMVSAELKAIVYRDMGIAYFFKNDFQQALNYVNKSLEISNSSDFKRYTRDNFYTLSQIHYKMGSTSDAYNFLSRYIEINESLFSNHLINSISYFNERLYQSERKEEIYRIKLQRNILVLIIAILAFIFLGSLALLLLKSYRENRKYIDKLKATIKEKEITESALRQSEDNYHTFIRTLNEALVVLDNNNRIEFVNYKACKLLDSEHQEDLLGIDFQTLLLTPEDEKLFRDKMELQKIGITDSYEMQIKTIRESVLWVNINSAPILDPYQNPKGSVNLISNITERKLNEQSYNELTTSLNQKIKQLNCMYDISDISGVPGISLEEIIEKSLEIIPVGLRYSHDIGVQVMFNNRIFSSKNYKDTPWSYTVPIKVQKKKLGYLKVNYLEEKPMVNRDAFHFNEKILLKNISEKFGQILESKNMNQHLRESQEKLQEVQKLAKIGNWERNLVTNQCVFSESFFDIAEITNEKRKFFDFDRFLDILHPDDKPQVANMDDDLTSKNAKYLANLYYRIITPTGIIKYIFSTRKIIKDETGQLIRCVYIVQDITDQKVNQDLKYNIEIALKTSEAKQQFLANMSHEMRTPMNGIMGMVDFLLRTDLTPEQLDFTRTIKDSSEGLLNILNDIIDLSIIEAGKFRIKSQTFSLKDMLEKIRGLFAALTRHKELSLKINVDNKIPTHIITDESRLYQVLTNLVSNAVKFTETGEILLNVKIENAHKDQMELLVEVIDSGPGIKPSQLENIFKPFELSDDGINNKQNEGTGLGLAISKKLVELLGGNIGVVNNSKRGCTFYFTFTITLPKMKVPNNKLPAHQNVNIIEKNLKGVKVLFVDDQKVNQKVISLMLKHVQCEVTIASNGKEALKLIGENDFDIILLDIVMPIMDGRTAFRELRKKYPYHPPVIALSANVLEEDKEEYLADGMNDYISKPVNAEVLYQKLTYWYNYRLAQQLKDVKK